MKLKLEGMEWDGRACVYHETIQKCVGLFRKALINNFGNREESDQLKEVREDMVRCTRTLARNGFTLCICEDFIERVEKTVQSGEIPEQKMDMTKTDDSVDNSVEGFVPDVTYVLTIPAVVKREKGENDDDDDELVIVRVTPVTMDPLLIQEVKKEARSPPPSPNRGEGMKEVSEDGSSSQKTVEKAQEENVLGELPSAEKPEEAESADKEGRALLLRTVLCRKNRSWQQRPKTQIQTLKKRHHQRNPPKAMLPKGRREKENFGDYCVK